MADEPAGVTQRAKGNVPSKRQRRPPASPAERSRRVAWGKKYGQLNREGWAQTKARQGIE